MGQEVWIRKDRGGNQVRLVDRRGVEITEEVNHSAKVTLQRQLEEIVGKFVLADSEGEELPLIQTLLDGIAIKDGARVETIHLGPIKNTTIAASGTVSTDVDLEGHFSHLLIQIPTIDSANISLQAALDPGGTFQALGSAVYAAGTGAKNNTFKLGGWRYIKVVTSAAQTSGAVLFLVQGVTY